MIVFAAKTDQCGDQDRVRRFHVLRAATVEIDVPLKELERIDGPFLASRFDHVEMTDQKDRPAGARAMKAGHQVGFSWIRAHDLRVDGGKTCVTKSLGHGLRSGTDVAGRVRRVDLDQLLENVARELAIGVARLRAEHDRGGESEAKIERDFSCHLGTRLPMQTPGFCLIRPLQRRMSPGRIHWLCGNRVGACEFRDCFSRRSCRDRPTSLEGSHQLKWTPVYPCIQSSALYPSRRRARWATRPRSSI